MKRLICRAALLAAVAMVSVAAAQAQDQAEAQGLPLAPARTLTIEARRGTWMSPDIAPDGQSLVFDMLGDLYSLPIAGGEARQLTQGLAFDSQPVFSPDGRWIAYVSDKSGAENLWVMRADGSGAHAITALTGEAVLTSPAWRADGKGLFVSRYYADRNNYELVETLLDGTERMIAPIRSGRNQPRGAWASTLGAAPSRDGRALFFAQHVGGVNFDEVDAWDIVRQDLASGRNSVVVGGALGRGHPRETVFRPAISPDGRLLAYATRIDNQTWLRLRDLASGTDKPLVQLDADQLESSGWQDIVPRHVFTPDGRKVLFTRGGTFHTVDVASGAQADVPMHARMAVDVGPSTRVALHEEQGPVEARLAMAPTLSPDGRRIAFAALGRLYVQDVAPDGTAQGAPRVLPTGSDGAYQPAFSPDGRALLYVSWDEARGGAIWRIDAEGKRPARALTTLPAFYSGPVFAPDGKTVLALRSPMAARQANVFEVTRLRRADLVALDAQGSTSARVIASGKLGGRAQFTPETGKAFLLTDDGLKAFDLANGAARTVAAVQGPGYYFAEGPANVDDMAVSPDGRWILAQIAQQLYLLPRPAGEQPVDVTEAASRAVRLTRRGADYFGWGADGAPYWSVGTTFRKVPLAEVLASPERGGAEGLASPIALVVKAPRALAPGRLLISGAKVLTMADGDKVLPDADILIDQGRIAAIGPRGTLSVPAGTPVRQVQGKTIVPGFIDEHDHVAEIHREVLSTQDWGLRARLAWGVITSFDPSTLSIDMLAYQDLLDSGAMLGPRLRSTGPAVFSYNRFASLADAQAVLSRYREDYRLGNIKEYRTGNRQVRQWVAMAARAKGLQPTTEGALSLKLDLSQMLDGFAGNEHALPAQTLGDDVLGLMRAMRVSYSTTMMVTHSAPDGADWFITAEDPAADPKIRRFWSPSAIRQKLEDRPWHPLRDYRFDIVGAGAAAVARAGGLVGMGAHGEVPGIGFHWEMEAHALGGMTPMEVLHAATAGSAETIGRLDDLGTLEPGKIADLVILDADPLADIRNTRKIAAVMRDGRLYDGETLAPLWPVAGPAPKAWFDAPGRMDQWTPERP